ncbi:sugar phosphate isomerase/epimerase [Arenibacter sp. GZD96]|uniref:sugar phosphate isomerase/epimerase family protein n=1 Tax=Aurantibrevibacter litoralis TaxID=3106030 RepID=UPI002AFE20D2|nr:sugar phosphate isomerase/epimerase [Arenibacter sp. GZD-96]MEA1785044.1 sugar phosphate isomerase/epimerase [Arenibacter sp. GZD-96]
MKTRREFLLQSATVTAGALVWPSVALPSRLPKIERYGVQLYSFRHELEKDVIGTLKQIASLGIKEIETAKSKKGHYYGVAPSEMKTICNDLGMNLKSGHVHLDDQWEKTMDEAAASGQEYLICSSMPSEGQTIDNYKKVADSFNKAGEDCKKRGIKFGYHNHDYEFESVNGTVLYDVLLNHTEADLVHMELDLGWVVVTGNDPFDYFKRYHGRFPLWHLKDMDLKKKESTEFGKGGLDIVGLIQNQKASGVKHIFIEQEEYASSAFESMEHNMDFLKNL